MDHPLKAKPTAEKILGAPPWDEDKLARACLAFFHWSGPAIEQFAGYKPATELDDLELSLQIFDHAVVGLDQAVAAFLSHSTTGQFGSRAGQNEYEQHLLSVRTAFFCAIASAAAFKDRTRTLAKRLQIAGYDQKSEATFTDSERYQFIQALRNHLSHVAPLSPEWIILSEQTDATQQARFLLYANSLGAIVPFGGRSGGDLRPRTLTQAFIDHHRGQPEDNLGHGGAIDIVTLLHDYRSDVHGFHLWLVAEVEKMVGPQLQEYRKAKQDFDRVTARMGWKAIRWPLICQSIDPRAVIDQMLLPEERVEVEKLPTSSDEQIEKIIEFLDLAGHRFMTADNREALRNKLRRAAT